jgi:hypothetical protein
MIIDAHATDTTPSHEVRQRAQEALANVGEPMSEITYDALRKRLATAEAEIKRLQAGGCARDQTTTQYCAEAVRLQDAIQDLAAHVWRGDWDKLQPSTRAALGKKQ